MDIYATTEEYINEHRKIIVDHINFLNLRNPPKWFIARDIESTYSGWMHDKNLKPLVEEYINKYRSSNNWQCQKIDGFMLWFGSWEIKPYNREFSKIPKHVNSKLLYAITNSYMLFAIAICY